MPQVTVTIAGRTYRMACGEGEEAHLEGLAAHYDGKIQEMRAGFGEIGDMRLHVMAALTVADDWTEMKRKLEALESEVTALRAQVAAGEERVRALEAQAAEALARTTERVERLTKTLSAPSPGSAPQPEA